MIVLKNIKTIASMSEETHCYSADLWFDGKKIGVVSNDGHGGCDRFHGDQAAYDRADAWCKAHLPTWDCNGTQEPTDLELRCGELVDAHVRDQEVARLANKIVKESSKKVFLLDGDAVRPFTFKNTAAVDARHIKAVQDKHPGLTLLNGKTKDEIKALLIASAA